MQTEDNILNTQSKLESTATALRQVPLKAISILDSLHDDLEKAGKKVTKQSLWESAIRYYDSYRRRNLKSLSKASTSN